MSHLQAAAEKQRDEETELKKIEENAIKVEFDKKAITFLRFAVCWIVLRCVAVRYSVLQCGENATQAQFDSKMFTILCDAVCCNVL